MKRASLLSVKIDSENSQAFNLGSTFRAEGMSVALDALRINGEHIDMDVCVSDLIIEGKIGQGACSSVNKAVHRRTGDSYAVKMFNIFNKSQRGQLFKEIYMLKDVQCEALVSFCGAFHTDGSVGVILEFMDRGSLDNIKPSHHLTESALGGIIFQVLWGLGYLHHDRNVHRDIKPGNVLMNSEGFLYFSNVPSF